MKHVSILFEFAFKYLTLAQLMISQQFVYCFSTIRIWRSAQPGFLANLQHSWLFLFQKGRLSGVGFEPTPGRPDCDLNAAPLTARPSWPDTFDLPTLTTEMAAFLLLLASNNFSLQWNFSQLISLFDVGHFRKRSSHQITIFPLICYWLQSLRNYFDS